MAFFVAIPSVAQSPISASLSRSPVPTAARESSDARKRQKGVVLEPRRSALVCRAGGKRRGDEDVSRETEVSWRDDVRVKLLGGMACGIVAASSVAWDLLPALAVPPSEDITPYARSAEKMGVGLRNGRIQACPLDINPNCVSTSSNNAGYAAPWFVPESSMDNASKKIETAILSTQKNPAIIQVDRTPEGGTYLLAEADGFWGRDVMEFLVKGDVVFYRSMAKRVVYIYPITTPIGDFDGQQKRIKTLEEELGWSYPTFDNTNYEES